MARPAPNPPEHRPPEHRPPEHRPPDGVPSLASASFADAAALAFALGPLRLARTQARGRSFHGTHPRRAAGAGSEFWQYRTLESGESADRVDWRRSARSDALFLREREREDPVRLWLWLDGSGSMDFASGPRLPTKAARGRLAATALAIAAGAGGERLQLLDAPGRAMAPDAVHARLGRAATPLGELEPPLRRGDVVLLAGDFLDGGLEAWVARAAGRGAIGVALAIIDPAEADFPFEGRVRFEPSEPGEVAHELARAEERRARYLAAWAEHEARLDALSATAGWVTLRHRTDADPAPLLRQAADWLAG